MIGIIVTGHGGFASGMEKNVKMIAGSSAELTAIDFSAETSLDELKETIKEAVDKYADCECTLILCDLAGGTPYNSAVTVSIEYPKVRVISGTNAPLLLDLVMRNVMEEGADDVDALAEEMMTSGRSGIGKFVLDMEVSEDEDGDGDGI